MIGLAFIYNCTVIISSSGVKIIFRKSLIFRKRLSPFFDYPNDTRTLGNIDILKIVMLTVEFHQIFSIYKIQSGKLIVSTGEFIKL